MLLTLPLRNSIRLKQPWIAYIVIWPINSIFFSVELRSAHINNSNNNIYYSYKNKNKNITTTTTATATITTTTAAPQLLQQITITTIYATCFTATTLSHCQLCLYLGATTSIPPQRLDLNLQTTTTHDHTLIMPLFWHFSAILNVLFAIFVHMWEDYSLLAFSSSSNWL